MADVLEDDYLTKLILNQKLPDLDLTQIKRDAVSNAGYAAKEKAAVDKIRAMSASPTPTPVPTPLASPTPITTPTPKPTFKDANGNTIQREDESTVSADPLSRTDWIQDKPTDPRSLSQNRESYNMIGDNLGKTIEKQDALVGRAEMARKPYVDRLGQMVDTYMQPVATFKSSYADMATKMLQQEAQEKKTARPDFQPPQRQEEDLLTKAIYALGPAAGAMLLGEDAALAAPTAQKQAYALRASDIAQKNKEYDQELAAYRANATREKNRDSNNSLRGMALKLLSEGEREDFNKQQDVQDRRMGEATKILSGLSADQSKLLDAAIQDRQELLKDQYSKGLISIDHYQDNVYKLSALQNQKDIADANLQAADKRFTTEEAGRNQRAKESNETTLKATGMRGDAQANVAGIRAKAAAAKGSKSGGKPLTISAAENMSNANTALFSLEDINSIVTKNPEMFGKGQNILNQIAIATGMGETGTKAASIDAELGAIAQRIGVYLEGGKLAEGDIKRYRKMLPELGDKPEIVQNKIASLKRMLEQKHNNDLESYRSSGYDVSRFERKQISAGITQGVGKKNEAGQFPMTIRKGNQEATVKNVKELVDARKKGWSN